MHRSRPLILLLTLFVVLAGCRNGGDASTASTVAATVATATSATASLASAPTASAPSPASAPALPATAASTATVPTAAELASPAASPTGTPAAAIGSAAAPATTDGLELGQRALASVEHLAGVIGSRPAGSQAERQAAGWLQQQLQALGYRSSLHTFPVRSFQDNGAQLEIQTPQPASIAVRNLNLGGSGDVSGQVIYAGLGRHGDFPAEVAGQIALVDRGQISFQAKSDAALAAGAVGLVIANHEPGELNGTLTSPASIPVVAVSQEDGRRLREMIAQGTVQARLAASTSVEETTSQNVIGARGGPSQPIIVVGGHYDSVAAGPGANDNASGTAAALEIARALAGETRAEVRFIAFGAEEPGLIGSRAYVESLSLDERRRIVLMVNLDMVGVGDRFLIGGSPEFADRALELARRAGIAAAQPLAGGRGASDHLSFMNASIPAVFLHWSDDPNYHTAGDRPSAIQPDLIADAARIALDLIDATLTELP